jgi:hypothetical protein
MQKILLSILAVSLFASGCNDKYPIDPLPADTSIPTLSVPFVSVSSTVYFTPFGAPLQSSSETSKGFELTMSDVNTEVLASTKAYITAVNMIAADNYEIHTEIKRNSIYDVIYGNVAGVTLQVGDSVVQSTILGNVGSNGKVTFRIERKDTRKALCPSTFGSSGFNNSFNTSLLLHNSANSDTLSLVCRVSEIGL